jgi:lipid A ethanolaminephosphotransferase
VRVSFLRQCFFQLARRQKDIALPALLKLLPRPRISSEWLSVLASAYLLVFMNLTFWKKSATYLSGENFALACLAIGLFAGFVAILVAFSAKYVIKPVLIFMIVSATASAWFMDRFGVVIDSEMIRNAAETTGPEAGHLITPAFLLHIALFGLLPSLLVIWVEVKHRALWRKVVRNLALITPAVLVLGGAGLTNGGTFIFNIREHRDWFRSLNPIFPIGATLHYVVKSTEEQNIKAEPVGLDAKVTDTFVPGTRKPRVTIIVVGETARAQNFQLGGYERETNPELSKRDIFYFKDTSSCGTATAVSVPCMFSRYTRSGYSHSKALATENLVDVLGHAGIRTEWWDNNTGDKGVADRIGSLDFFKMKDPQYCTDGECLDGIMLDKVDGWLDGVKGDSVLVLHQLGNHGPAYYARYPQAFRKFTPDCRTVEFSDCTPETITNAYDNGLLYTDFILSSLIDKLKARDQSLDTSMIYMSDHGESLGENGLYLHGTPYMFAPSQQTHIPFVLWFGSTAKAAIDTNCLSTKTAEPASQDNLFHTVLGMMHVETEVRDPALDIVTACRPAES